MKNLNIAFLALLLISPVLLSAQYSKPARIFGQGQVDLQAAVGLFPTYVADKPEAILPPVQIGLRWMVGKQVSLGAFAGYSLSRSREKLLLESVQGRWDNKTYFLGLENGFHYTKVDNWDVYGGLSLLYQYVQIDSESPEFKRAMAHSGMKEHRGKMALTAFIGSRFALSAHYSVFLELGYGISLLKVGAGYKL